MRAAGGGIRDAWHGVQFYDDDQQLCASVSDYLAAGFVAGDALMVVSTPEHWSAFSDRLQATGHDVDGARAEGQLVTLDARETLSRFVRDSMPDESLFRATLEPQIVRCTHEKVGRLRIYGEMVDLLWRDGNTLAALLLEQQWNGLHQTGSFWLFCGYVSEPFELRSTDVQDICGAHTHVIQTRVGSAKRSSGVTSR
ncbi:MAG TPA: MEDS domain-containing protein [Polyangiales bacterium]|nr:MEDS domain-containing protein [Polyangiales bacterium]